jgi:hypothetical protein
MEKQVDKGDLELIRRIIAEEEKSALDAFRKGGFERTVRTRLRERQDRPRREPVPLRRLAPALIIGLIVVITATVMILRPGRPSSVLTAEDIGALWRMLDGAPGVRVLSGSEVPDAVLPGHLPDLQNTFAQILDLLRQQEQSREREIPCGHAGEPVPRLSFRDKVRILYRDKVIERALLVALEKSKEV